MQDSDAPGTTSEVVVVNGITITNPLNHETVSIRCIIPGEFTVNVHMDEFAVTPEARAQGIELAVPVSVKVERLNPVVRVLFFDKVMLAEQGDEKTAVRFTVMPDGSVIDVNTLPKKLYGRPG